MLIFRALLALVVLLPLTPSQAYSPQNDTAALPTWTKYAADSPVFFLNMTDRSLTIDPASGAPCVAYGGDALYYSCQNPINGIWSTHIVDTNVQVGEYAAVDYNSKGWPFITYYDAHNARAKLAYYDGNNWNLLVVPNAETELVDAAASETDTEQPAAPQLDDSGPVPPPPASEVVPARQVVDEQPVLPFEVAPEEQLVPSVPEAPALAEPDSPAATEPATQVEDETSMTDQIMKVLQPWLQPNDPNYPIESVGYGKHTSIAIDGRDHVHIVYHDEIDGSLEYIHWDGFDFWDIIVDDPHDQGDVGLWNSIAVDYFYNVYISYMDEKYDNLKFAFHSAANPPYERWRIETVDGIETQINMGTFSSIALEQDLTGDNEKTFTPHISYYDFTHNTLRHAWRRWDASTRRYHWEKEVVDNGGTNGIVGWYSSIGVDANDVVHISYFDVRGGNLKYARKSGGSWTRSTLDSSGTSLTGLFTSLVIDGNNRPCISYLHGNSGELRVICRTNTNQNKWTIYKVVTQGHDVGMATSIAVDVNSQVHVSYMDITSGALKYARSFGPVFGLTTFGAPYAGRYSSIDTDNGWPRIAYDEQGQQEVMFASQSGSGWHYSQVDSTYNVGQFVSMELDGNARPHISYYDATHDKLIYATFPINATKWYTTTVDVQGVDVGWYTSLALDSGGNPWIAYYDNSNGSLKIAMRSPIGAWVARTVESIGDLPEEGVGWYASLDIDQTNLPHISYYDFTNRRLRYAYYTGTWGSVGSPGTWNFATVDSGVNLDVGRYTSLEVDGPTGTRHICYYDLTNKNLKYAQWTAADGWQKQIVDGAAGAGGSTFDEGDVGMFCSIALNPAGLPAISYYDNSRADLRVAVSFPLTVPPGLAALPVIFKP